MMRGKKGKANKGDGEPPPQSHNDLPLFLTPPVGPVSGFKTKQNKNALLPPRPSEITTQVVQSTGTPTFITFIYFYNYLLI